MNPIALLIAAVAANVLTSLFKSVEWSPKRKHLVASVVSFFMSGVAMFLSGGITAGADFLTVILAVHGGSQVFYSFLFKETKLNKALSG